jgi:FkbM family methyltransferase
MSRAGTVIHRIAGGLLLNSRKRRQKSWKKSYAQSGEDLIVDHIFHSIGIQKPTYIDIGAYHPENMSNTALFYERGATGINVEPDPVLFSEFARARPRDVNVNAAIGEESGEVDFFRFSVPTLNTVSASEASHLASSGTYSVESIYKVRSETLPEVLRLHHGGTCPQFLSLDVEGLELAILKSFDLDVIGPIVACVETISFCESGRGIKDQELIGYMESKNYLTYADTNINTIFVRRDCWIRE